MIHVELVTQIVKFKTAMLKSSLCNYSDQDMLARGLEQEQIKLQYWQMKERNK